MLVAVQSATIRGLVVRVLCFLLILVICIFVSLKEVRTSLVPMLSVSSFHIGNARADCVAHAHDCLQSTRMTNISLTSF
jgi:hypothetical protein